jgi:glycosyltransferase involved in cell wall biosynthesis
VSVLIPTINRPESVVRTVASLLADRASRLQVVVIDQHADGLARQALARMALTEDPRLHVLVTRERGESVARNIGRAVATGDFVLCTDDDCEAPAGWADSLANALESGGQDLVFGPLEAIESSDSEYFTPSWIPLRVGPITKSLARRKHFGTTANLAIRRVVLDQLGGFDNMLGAGCAFGAADDLDLIYRAVIAGYRVTSLSAPSMRHHGERIGRPQIRALFQRNFIGIGSWYMKHIRCGDRNMVGLFLNDIHEIVREVLWSSLRRGRPEGLGKVGYLLLGFVLSLGYSVDSRTRLYRAQTSGGRKATVTMIRRGMP